jgi:hypothetical protein
MPDSQMSVFQIFARKLYDGQMFVGKISSSQISVGQICVQKVKVPFGQMSL